VPVVREAERSRPAAAEELGRQVVVRHPGDPAEMAIRNRSSMLTTTSVAPSRRHASASADTTALVRARRAALGSPMGGPM
jgi:hypothetical protein